MKTYNVVGAMIVHNNKLFVTQRGYGEYKDYWEFPGGKIEAGETPEEALKREIREELDTEIEVEKFIDHVEYDYPDFHLSMDLFLCHVASGKLTLLEHEAAKWLSQEDVNTVNWLPADHEIVERMHNNWDEVFKQ